MTRRPTGGRDDTVCVAQIGAAHGLKGEVRLWSYTQDPNAVADYGVLLTEDGAREFSIDSLRSAKDHFIARLSGISSREEAEALRNIKLYVPRDRLPAPDDDATFYHSDLIGLTVLSTSGELLGELIAVHNFGASDILEVRLTDKSTVMLPFTEIVVPSIDLAQGKIVIDPPTEIASDEDAFSPQAPSPVLPRKGGRNED